MFEKYNRYYYFQANSGDICYNTGEKKISFATCANPLEKDIF